MTLKLTPREAWATFTQRTNNSTWMAGGRHILPESVGQPVRARTEGPGAGEPCWEPRQAQPGSREAAVTAQPTVLATHSSGEDGA